MPPHVCFVSDTLHTYLGSGIETGAGGAERQQYKVATALVERGYDVTGAHARVRLAAPGDG